MRLTQQTGDLLGHSVRRDCPEMFILKEPQAAKSDAAKTVGLLQNAVEHRGEITGRGIDHLQDLGGCGLSGQRLVPLGVGCGTLTLEIGNDLPGISQRAVRRRVHLRTSPGRLSKHIIP
jgi:hypothetical protein